MSLAARLSAVIDSITKACEACDRDPATVALLPVSKRHPPAAILEAKAAGLSIFGENRVQEIADKSLTLADESVEWHFVGSLQTNKVGTLLSIPTLTLVQSLDRIKLADALQKDLATAGRTLPVLLQINATPDSAKHGATPADVIPLLHHITNACPDLQPTGVMAMGPLHGDATLVFQRIAALHEDLRQSSGLALPTRSMGMTADLPQAIAAGSTLVRVGTGIFGPRPRPVC